MRNKRSIFVFLSIVIAFFAAGIITEIFLPVRSILFSVLSPPYTGIEKGSALLAGELGIISFKSDVALREAKKENALLRINSAKINAAQYECNAVIKDAVTGNNYVNAAVVGKRVDGYTSVLIIDKGNDNGVKEGNVVLYEGALAGYVDSVSSDKSLVKSAFSPLNEINGVLTDAKIPILLFGKGAGLYSSRVPKDTKTEIGSVVVTDYSNDYIIGEIVQVRENEQDPFKELLIISPFNPIVVNTVKIKIE